MLRSITILLLTSLILFAGSCSQDSEREPTISSPAVKTILYPYDILTDEVEVLENNKKPEITSPDLVEATGDLYFNYVVHFTDPDGPDAFIQFGGYPSWLSSDGDSLFGTPPDGAADTSFIVSVSDGQLTDYISVTINMIPCLVVYGDSRTGHVMHQTIVDLMTNHSPLSVFHSGDLVNNGNIASEWSTFNSITEDLFSNAEFFPALGNHERQSQLYFDNFELPGNEQWYSVERNNIHFIILNSCVDTDIGSEQYLWLEADLASVGDSVKFIAAVFHHPPYSTGPHTEDEMGLRQTFVPLFEQYGVDIVFNGHDHSYERSFCGSIYYIVTGGGGAPLRDQAREYPCSQLFLKKYHYCKLSSINDSLYIKVFDNNSILIDHISLESYSKRITSNVRSGSVMTPLRADIAVVAGWIQTGIFMLFTFPNIF